MKHSLVLVRFLFMAAVFPAVALASVSVSLSPTTIHVLPGRTTQFTATVAGTTNSVVIWSLSGVSCSGIACGSITSGGLYLAPPTAPTPNVVTVTATSLADITKSASAAAIIGSASDVTVSVSPSAVNVLVGQRQLFTATVGGTNITGVTWRLSGAGCSGVACGTITSAGLYTAPANPPNPPQVLATATSVADPTKSATATVTVIPPVVVTVSPTTAQVVAGGQQQFTATVTGTSNTKVTWSVAGTGCSGATCGTITSAGLYTAPATIPSPPQVTVTATSVADSTKSASATVTVIPPVVVTVSPTTAQVVTGAQQQFTASVTGTSNTKVTWSVAGTGCSGATCGTITSAGLYTAPAAVPSPPQVFVTATSVADPTKSATATVTVIPPVVVTVSPTTAQVVIGAQQQFTATVTGTSNTNVTWSVTGSGCSGATCGTTSSGGLYTAPATIPSPPQVTVTATSVADSTKSAGATVTVIPPVAVSILPTSVQVVAGAQQQFTAAVTGTSNTKVTWSVAGTGCSGATCGTITSAGLYTAPATIPSPPQVFVTATSVADPTKSATATVTVIPPVVVTVAPTTAQVVTGAQQQFTATVTGTSNTKVTWSVAGTGCSGATCGTITSAGLYTAPATPPNPRQVFVTATSVADPTKSATATVTVLPPVAVTVSPATAQVATKAQQQFTATVTGTSNASVTWSVTGSGCSGATCGTITSAGLYTAPGTIPNPPQVTVKATSVADPTKSATATVTVVPPVVVTVSPTSAQVVTGSQQQFTAKVTGTSNTKVNWSLTGFGCAGTTCGTISTTGLYTAPSVVPNPAQVFVTATSVADSTKSSTATVTVVPPVAVTISPTSAQVVIGAQQQFTATITGTSNINVTWSVTGSGCSGAACGTISSTGRYTAPGVIPKPPQVTVTVTSVADTTKSASATVTIVPPVMVTISPTSAQVSVGKQQQFTATVTGSTNTSVTWKVTGSGCSGASCGTVTANGLYTAPGKVPSPPNVTVKATSVADTTKSATATVTITPPVAVTVSPASTQVVAGARQQFTAAVTGTSNTKVTWSIAGTGCAGATCGTITSAGLYTAPATPPNPPQVTVKATSVADTTKSGSAAVTIISAPTVSVTPTNALVALNNQQQFRATVTGSNNMSVAWSVSGPGCSGTGCGIINSAGLYLAPASLPSPATVIVKASAEVDLSQSASAVITIVASDNSKLVGGYAFLFTGFDSKGVYQAAGSFTADGNGHITSGREDVNNTARPQTNVPLTGTYQVAADNRGVLTLSSTLGTQTFAFAVTSLGAKGRFIEFDHSGIRGSGVFELQDPSAFSTSSFTGSYALSLAGKDVAEARIGAIGVAYLNGSGGVSAGSLDVNDGGVVSPTFAPFHGIYSVDNKGRGTLTLDIPGFAGGVFNFAFYVVAADQFLMISTDQIGSTNPIFSGPAELQTGVPFQASSFKGATVFSLSGNNGNASQVTVGRITFDGNQQMVAEFDENTGGAVTTANVLTGAYAVQINGRGILNLDNSNGLTREWLITTISPNRAFIMDGLTADVGMGEVDPQLTKPPFLSSDIVGAYVLGSGEPLVSAATLYSGTSNFDGSSMMNGSEDISYPSSLAPNQTMTGTYTVSSSSNNGRGVLLLTSPNTETIVLWVADQSDVLGLGIDSSNLQPILLHLEQ